MSVVDTGTKNVSLTIEGLCKRKELNKDNLEHSISAGLGKFYRID